MSITERRITPESAQGELIIFHPKTEADAEDLQKKLLASGFAWANGGREPANLADSVTYGLVILDGKLYTRSASDTRPYQVCQPAQADPDYLPPDMQRLMNCFNIIAERLDGIERRLANLENPPPLDKPVLKAAGPGRPA